MIKILFSSFWRVNACRLVCLFVCFLVAIDNFKKPDFKTIVELQEAAKIV